MKLVKACIAMAAFAALVVVPSVASASPLLTSPTGTTAPAGLSIQATNVAHAGTAKHTLMTTSAGNVTCDTATLTGALEKNTGTHIAGNITTVQFEGPAGGPCSSPLGNVTITPNHTTNPVHNGQASLPWCVTANTLDDKITLRGGLCSQAARPLTFAMHTPIGECEYWKASVTATYTTHPAAAIATVSGEEFKKTTGSVFCPESGKLDMAFTLETDVANPQDVYVD